jgi:poly [ADP-ribose] polymerase
VGHVIEAARSGRAKCRGCGKPIAKEELRLGERHPNPFGDGEMTLWFHLLCGAYKRPEVLHEALEATAELVEEKDTLNEVARQGIEHRRLPRLDGVQRASTGRARCRSCRELIAKNGWRIRLVYFQDARFEPSGYIHASCSGAYFETTDILPRLRHFSPEITEEDIAELRRELHAPTEHTNPRE